jgi:hypothetical protein
MDNKINTYQMEKSKKNNRITLKKRGLAVLLAASFATGFGANSAVNAVANEIKTTPEERHDRQLTKWEEQYDGYDFHNTDEVYISPGDIAWDTAYREVSDNLGITMGQARDIVQSLNPDMHLGDLQPGDVINVPSFIDEKEEPEN